MKNLSLHVALTLVTVLILGSTNGFAQGSSASVETYARVIRPINIREVDDLNFGAVYCNETGGIVQIEPDYNIKTPSHSLRHTEGIRGKDNDDDEDEEEDDNRVDQGKVIVSGEAGFYYTVDVETTELEDGKGHKIKLDRVVFDPVPNVLPQIYGQLPGSLTEFQVGDSWQLLNVGATLHVEPHQAPGVYRGSISLTARYQ